MMHAIRHARLPRRSLLIALSLTAMTVATWIGTGTTGYTTFNTIETVDTAPGDDDPFADTGLYDTPIRSVRETPGFRLGLLPTPSGLLDAHMISVLTLVVLAWGPFALLYGRALWRARCREDGCLANDPSLHTRSR